EIAHLPLARIAEEDAIRAARQGTVVVTTTLSHRRTDHVKGLEDLFRDNLKLLARHGVRIAIGTDDNGRTVLDEALNLHRLGVFDNLTLLKMWSVATPQSIFPGRRIGRFEEGY
ncbi:MAG TPA: amidohydrolase, partial [Blastocatellia bacterium]|nr:amidohydrolase [Blastocatellia bacterium]